MKAKILSMLKESGDFISGETLSRKLGVSRTTIWNNINLLKSSGYVIESVTNRGYRLVKCPEALDISIISDKLDTAFIGKEIRIMQTVDSTNEEVKRCAAAGAKSGLIVAADTQTAGKGRLGRVWSSESGYGLYFTILIRPEISPTEISSLTLAAGYAVCLAIREYTGCDAKIKWPNDVIINNKKVCGILTEMTAQSDRIDFLAIGIGINVNHSTFPDSIINKATSLFLEAGEKIDRNKFFNCLIKKLDKVLSSFLVSISLEDINTFKMLCATIGRRVSVKRGNTTVEGTAVDITPRGELIIIDNENNEIPINSGEVTVQGIY